MITDKGKFVGRPIARKYTADTAADLIRKHLRERRLSININLAAMWGVKPNTAHRRLYHNAAPLTPEMIEAFVVGASLTTQEAYDLHYLAAKGYGFKI